MNQMIPAHPPTPPAALHNRYVCTQCGSQAISREAWAEWDAAAQDWIIATLFDFAHCHGCGAHAAPRPVAL